MLHGHFAACMRNLDSSGTTHMHPKLYVPRKNESNSRLPSSGDGRFKRGARKDERRTLKLRQSSAACELCRKLRSVHALHTLPYTHYREFRQSTRTRNGQRSTVLKMSKKKCRFAFLSLTVDRWRLRTLPNFALQHYTQYIHCLTHMPRPRISAKLARLRPLPKFPLGAASAYTALLRQGMHCLYPHLEIWQSPRRRGLCQIST